MEFQKYSWYQTLCLYNVELLWPCIDENGVCVICYAINASSVG